MDGARERQRDRAARDRGAAAARDEEPDRAAAATKGPHAGRVSPARNKQGGCSICYCKYPLRVRPFSLPSAVKTASAGITIPLTK